MAAPATRRVAQTPGYMPQGGRAQPQPGRSAGRRVNQTPLAAHGVVPKCLQRSKTRPQPAAAAPAGALAQPLCPTAACAGKKTFTETGASDPSQTSCKVSITEAKHVSIAERGWSLDSTIVDAMPAHPADARRPWRTVGGGGCVVVAVTTAACCRCRHAVNTLQRRQQRPVSGAARRAVCRQQQRQRRLGSGSKCIARVAGSSVRVQQCARQARSFQLPLDCLALRATSTRFAGIQMRAAAEAISPRKANPSTGDYS